MNRAIEIVYSDNVKRVPPYHYATKESCVRTMIKSVL